MSTPPPDDQLAVRAPAELQTSIDAFGPAMVRYLADLGLPTQKVLAPVDERRKIIDSLHSALAGLAIPERQRAVYLTRFTVAVSVGLFDGALAYLWDETVAALRRLVARFDLGYFFSVAEKISSRNKNFHTEDDLQQVGEHDLLEACRRIGLLSDVNHKRLEHVNYMRNHASSAHPNENEIDGFEMVGWLTTCLRYAITAEPEHSVIKIKVLLDNVRMQAIPASDFALIGSEVAKLALERIDDLLWTLFGIFIDPRQTGQTKANITGIAAYVWNAASADRKFEIGSKYGTFRKNADILRKDASSEFLRLVGGNSYKDEDSLAGEILERLSALKSVHFGANNFYNEYAHARLLGESLPVSGVVPRAARPGWVKVISMCYIGNGYGYRKGVDEGALPSYERYVSNFTEPEVIEFLHLFADPEFAAPLDRPMCDRRARTLAQALRGKTSDSHIVAALDLVVSAPERTLDRLMNTSAYRSALQYTPKAA